MDAHSKQSVHTAQPVSQREAREIVDGVLRLLKGAKERQLAPPASLRMVERIKRCPSHNENGPAVTVQSAWQGRCRPHRPR
jgi:hypothetical protein